MGVLIEALEDKYGSQVPALTAAAGIRQRSKLDPKKELQKADAEEADKTIYDYLTSKEGDVIRFLNQGVFAFPCPDHDLAAAWPTRTQEQREDLRQGQIVGAAEALEEYVLGELFMEASKVDQTKFPRALFYLGDKTLGKKGSADLKLDNILAGVLNMGQTPPSLKGPNKSIGTILAVQGDEDNGSEYRSRSRTRPNEEDTIHADIYTGKWY